MSEPNKKPQSKAKTAIELFNSAAFIDQLFAKFDGYLVEVVNPDQDQLVLSYDEAVDIRNRLTDVSRFLQSIASA